MRGGVGKEENNGISLTLVITKKNESQVAGAVIP